VPGDADPNQTGQNPTPARVNEAVQQSPENLQASEQDKQSDYTENLTQRDEQGNPATDDKGRPQALDQAGIDNAVDQQPQSAVVPTETNPAQDPQPSDADPASEEHADEAARPDAWNSPDLANDPNVPPRGDIRLEEDRRVHILDGDATGGGHRHGTGKPGKSEFPSRWSDDQTAGYVEDVARNPDSVTWIPGRDSWEVQGVRDGVTVTVAILPSGWIASAWPEPGGRGVVTNPRQQAPSQPLPALDRLRISGNIRNRILTEHGPNSSVPGNHRFPADWSAQRITEVINEIAREAIRNHHAQATPVGPNLWRLQGVRDGVTVTVDVRSDGRIRDASPEPGGRGVTQVPPAPAHEEASQSNGSQSGADGAPDVDASRDVSGPSDTGGARSGDPLSGRRGVAPDGSDTGGSTAESASSGLDPGTDSAAPTSGDVQNDNGSVRLDEGTTGPVGESAQRVADSSESDQHGVGRTGESPSGEVREETPGTDDRVADGASRREGVGRPGDQHGGPVAEVSGADLQPGTDGSLADPGRARSSPDGTGSTDSDLTQSDRGSTDTQPSTDETTGQDSRPTLQDVQQSGPDLTPDDVSNDTDVDTDIADDQAPTPLTDEQLADLQRGFIRNDHQIIAVAEDSPLRDAALRIGQRAGRLQLAIVSVDGQPTIGDQRLSYDDVLRIIKSSPEYQEHLRKLEAGLDSDFAVDLVSCGAVDLALHLAQNLQVQVDTSETYAWVFNNGQVASADGVAGKRGFLPAFKKRGFVTAHPDGTVTNDSTFVRDANRARARGLGVNPRLLDIERLRQELTNDPRVQHLDSPDADTDTDTQPGEDPASQTRDADTQPSQDSDTDPDEDQDRRSGQDSETRSDQDPASTDPDSESTTDTDSGTSADPASQSTADSDSQPDPDHDSQSDQDDGSPDTDEDSDSTGSPHRRGTRSAVREMLANRLSFMHSTAARRTTRWTIAAGLVGTGFVASGVAFAPVLAVALAVGFGAKAIESWLGPGHDAREGRGPAGGTSLRSGLFAHNDAPYTNLNMLRNGHTVPRTQELIAHVALAAGIDLTGIDVRIVEDPDEIRFLDEEGARAYVPTTPGLQQIRLGPAAFADRDTLARTLAHEQVHIQQLRSGVRVTHSSLPQLEEEAHAAEDPAAERQRQHSLWDSPEFTNDPDRPPLDENLRIEPSQHTHIFQGDNDGGGHAFGANRPGKTEFPERWGRVEGDPEWNTARTEDLIRDVVRHPDTIQRGTGDYWIVEGVRDGVNIRVRLKANGWIHTAIPLPGGLGVNETDPYLPPSESRDFKKKLRVICNPDYQPGMDGLRSFTGWTPGRIEDVVRSIARNPEQAIPHQPNRNEWILIGTHDGVTISVRLVPNVGQSSGSIVDAGVGIPTQVGGTDTNAPERGTGGLADGSDTGTVRGSTDGETRPGDSGISERG